MQMFCFQPPTPTVPEGENRSQTNYSSYIQNVASSNISTDGVLEVWTPELWQPDSRTGKMRKHRLANEDALSGSAETTPMNDESEQIECNHPSATLLPVEEEEDQMVDEAEGEDEDEDEDENENGEKSFY